MANARTSIPVWAALLGSGLAGMLVGVQSRINGGLGQQLGDGYVAAAVSFGSGLLILSILMLCSPRTRQGLGQLRTEVRSRRFPVWGMLGGMGGAFFVLSQGLVASVLGVALFTVGIVAGQVLGGLAMDRIGLGPGGRVNPTPQRLVGTVLAVIAVAVAVSADIGGGKVWLAIVPLVVGAGVAWQSAVNGLVRAVTRSAIAATFLNFVVGTVLLVTFAAVSVAIRGWPAAWPSSPWLYVGGVMGVLFIAIASILVRTAGVLLLSMSNVAGQLIAAVLLEAGLPLADGVTVGLLIGASVALIAVVIAAIPQRSNPKGRASE